MTASAHIQLGSAPLKKASAPAFGILFALGALGLGVISFLIAGFEGHSAGWEMLALPTMISLFCASIGVIGAVVSFMRKAIGGGVVMLGMSAFGALLALTGFVLGA